jgi:hypothetical protein
MVERPPIAWGHAVARATALLVEAREARAVARNHRHVAALRRALFKKSADLRSTRDARDA